MQNDRESPVEYIQVNNNNCLIIDDWYNPHEYDSVLTECKFLSVCFKDPTQSGSALGADKSPLKGNKAVFLDHVYKDILVSNIIRYGLDKSYDQRFQQILAQTDACYMPLYNGKHENFLLSYYEHSDYYKAHTDNANITFLTWLYDDPKSFEGGDLNLYHGDDLNGLTLAHTIECKANRTVIFPSFISHEVTPISMEESNKGKNKGRFTVSQFINYK
jgi:Rps23 Pro-64 3,4-dihydroxylase Tpa1-like proline 4-hydroxylase